MVKITNPLGDVKIGRQGEVVYQRKYGEQIRRQVSPKRAMASEAQIAHRQLYRDALTWRSQLSLTNRRYLDGYCYTNRVVDNYHIPLPWSRFALKIYLQAIKFVPDLQIISIPGETGEKKDYTEEQAWQGLSRGQEKWWAQTFTPLETYTLGKVGFLLGRNAAFTQDVIASIRLTDDGFPIGSDLIIADKSGATVPTQPDKDWWYIDFPPTLELQQDVMYAVIMRAPDATNYYIQPWRTLDNTRYPRGQRLDSVDSGQSWSKYSYDWNFEVWSAEITGEYSKAGILHARHPALMSVVHKRGELIVNGYDNLSSLDEEYLTKQVGLDVEAGDLIKATTLPGIEYAYPVG